MKTQSSQFRNEHNVVDGRSLPFLGIYLGTGKLLFGVFLGTGEEDSECTMVVA